eukprot:Em0003g360a
MSCQVDGVEVTCPPRVCPNSRVLFTCTVKAAVSNFWKLPANMCPSNSPQDTINLAQTAGSCGGITRQCGPFTGKNLASGLGSYLTSSLSVVTTMEAANIVCGATDINGYETVTNSSSIIYFDTPGNATMTTTVNDTTVSTIWTPPTMGGVPTSYNISINGRNPIVIPANGSNGSLMYTYTGLESDTLYEVSLVIINCVGTSNATTAMIRTYVSNITYFMASVASINGDNEMGLRRSYTIAGFWFPNQAPNQKNSSLSVAAVARPQSSDGRSIIRCFKCHRTGHISRKCRQQQVTCYNCDRPGQIARNCRQQPSENGIETVARAPAHPDGFLKPQEYITAAMTDKVTIVNGKLEGNDVRIMLDSGSSVSLIDKGSVPKQCIVSGQMPQLQTADGHKLTVMGTVKANLQLEQFSTEHGFLVTNSLITPVILGIDFLSKHKVRLDYSRDLYMYVASTAGGENDEVEEIAIPNLGDEVEYVFSPAPAELRDLVKSTCAGTVTVPELTLEDVAQEQGKDEVLNEPSRPTMTSQVRDIKVWRKPKRG